MSYKIFIGIMLSLVSLGFPNPSNLIIVSFGAGIGIAGIIEEIYFSKSIEKKK